MMNEEEYSLDLICRPKLILSFANSYVYMFFFSNLEKNNLWKSIQSVWQLFLNFLEQAMMFSGLVCVFSKDGQEYVWNIHANVLWKVLSKCG